MAIEPNTASKASPSLRAPQIFGMAAVCLVAGLVIGYVSRGSKSQVSPAQPPAVALAPSALPAAIAGPPAARMAPSRAPAPSPSGAMGGGHRPTLADMKQMADKQAAPLLQKLKSDPSNSALLVQVGAIYHGSHQFKEAAGYYAKAAQADPKNVAIRTKLASSLYRDGDVDGAIAQLNQALAYDPKDANSLFDLGMIKLKGKQDGKGALAAWQLLLKSNPQLSEDRKAVVVKMMAQVMTMLGDQHGNEGAPANDGHK